MRQGTRRGISRLMKAAIALALAVLLLHLGAVYLLRQQAEQLLHPGPGEGVYLGDVHLNLFSGTLAIDGLELGERAQPYLKVHKLLLDLDMTALLSGELELQNVQLFGGSWRVTRNRDGSIDPGIALPVSEASETDEADVGIALMLRELALKEFHIRYTDLAQPQLGEQVFAVQHLDVRDLVLPGDQAGEQPGNIEAALAWGEAKLALKGQLSAKPFFRGQLQLDQLELAKALQLARDKLQLSGLLSGEWQLSLDRQLALKGKAGLQDLDLRDPAYRVVAGKLQLEGLQLTMPLDAPEQLSLAGERISGEKLSLQQRAQVVSGEALALEGAWQVDLGQNTYQLGELGLELAQLDIQDIGLLAKSERLDLQLKAAQGSLESPALEAALSLTGIHAEPIELGGDSLSIDRVTLPQIKLEGESLQLSGAELSQLALQQGPLSLARVTLGPSAFADNHLAIGELVLDRLQTRVQRDAQGVWQLPVPTNPPSSAAGSLPEPGAEPLRWSLAGVRVTGDSQLHLIDQSMQPALDKHIQLAELKLGALDSRRSNADTPLSLELQPDPYSALKMQAKLRPLSESVYLDAEGELNGLELAQVNALVADSIGHRFLAGQMDNSFSLNIDKQHLKMVNKLLLEDLDVEAIEGQQGPPLGAAIALLQDRDGKFSLDVPIEGDLDNPDFKVLAALNPIIVKAVAGAATLAIQPLGSVLLVGSLLADQALKVSFDPALFDAKSAQLSAGADDKLKLLAGKLRDKPKLRLRLCGMAAAADQTLDKKGKPLLSDEQLLALADQRAAKVRSLMLGEGVDESQLRSCRPAIDDKPEGKPRVAIRF